MGDARHHGTQRSELFRVDQIVLGALQPFKGAAQFGCAVFNLVFQLGVEFSQLLAKCSRLGELFAQAASRA